MHPNEMTDAVRSRLESLSIRIDSLSSRVDSLSTHFDTVAGPTVSQISKLSGRLDTLAFEQSRLAGDLSAVRLDHPTALDLAHRITRLEDRLFAPPLPDPSNGAEPLRAIPAPAARGGAEKPAEAPRPGA